MIFSPSSVGFSGQQSDAILGGIVTKKRINLHLYISRFASTLCNLSLFSLFLCITLYWCSSKRSENSSSTHGQQQFSLVSYLSNSLLFSSCFLSHSLSLTLSGAKRKEEQRRKKIEGKRKKDKKNKQKKRKKERIKGKGYLSLGSTLKRSWINILL